MYKRKFQDLLQNNSWVIREQFLDIREQFATYDGEYDEEWDADTFPVLLTRDDSHQLLHTNTW